MVESYSWLARLGRRQHQTELQQAQRPNAEDDVSNRVIVEHGRFLKQEVQLHDVGSHADVNEQQLRELVSSYVAFWQQPTADNQQQQHRLFHCIHPCVWIQGDWNLKLKAVKYNIYNKLLPGCEWYSNLL